MTGRRAARAVVAVAALSAGASWIATRAEQTRVATTPAPLLVGGESDGVAVTTKGRLFLAPRVVALGPRDSALWPAHVFCSTGDAKGNLYFGTGPDGAVLRLTPAGDLSVPFRAPEPLVTAVLALDGGDLLVATAPGGAIYRVRPDGQSTRWCDTEERYVWALLAGSGGRVLAATGERGRLLSIDGNGKAAILFDSDETHIVSLARAADGGVWAGGAGRGLVYHVDVEGHAETVYDDDLPEAKSLVAAPEGGLIVAFDAPPASERRPPAVRIRMGGGAATAEGIDDLEPRATPSIQGVIEGLPSESEEDQSRIRGKIVRIMPDGAATELWRSSAEAPFAVTLDDRGRPLFATGEPARLWRVESASEVTLLATLREAQATSLVATKDGVSAATSNPAAAYRVEPHGNADGTYLAPPSDAGGVARWGTLSWRVDPPAGHAELFVRTGNSDSPDATWSAWGPALTEASGSTLTAPDGRYLQWRLRLSGEPSDGPRLSAVGATYATRNRAPALKDLRVDPPSGAVAGKVTLRWSASDPDGDPVNVEIVARLSGTTEWKSVARVDPAPPRPSDPSQGNDGSPRDGKTTWETATWDEGAYDVRAVGSDQAANPPGAGLEAVVDLTQTVRVDRTPPTIEARRGGGGVDVVVSDEISNVARLEIVENARVLFTAVPKDGMCDGPRESFRLSASDAGAAGARSLRATDAAGNAAEIAVPAP